MKTQKKKTQQKKAQKKAQKKSEHLEIRENMKTWELKGGFSLRMEEKRILEAKGVRTVGDLLGVKLAELVGEKEAATRAELRIVTVANALRKRLPMRKRPVAVVRDLNLPLEVVKGLEAEGVKTIRELAMVSGSHLRKVLGHRERMVARVRKFQGVLLAREWEALQHYMKTEAYQEERRGLLAEAKKGCPEKECWIADELVAYCGDMWKEGGKDWYTRVKDLVAQGMTERELVETLYAEQELRKRIRGAVLKRMEEKMTLRVADFEKVVPRHVRVFGVLEGMLEEVVGEGMLARREEGKERLYDRVSVVEYAAKTPDERGRDFALSYLRGETLEMIGARYQLTRERVRQVLTGRILSCPAYREDRFRYLFDTYVFRDRYGNSEFEQATGEPHSTHRYLALVSKKMQTEKNAEWADLVRDMRVPEAIRQRVQEMIARETIPMADGTKLRRRKSDFVQYYLKTWCRDAVREDVFHARYTAFVAGLEGLTDAEREKLYLGERSMLNLRQRHPILCSQHTKFRYFDYDAYDFKAFEAAIDWARYKGGRTSTRTMYADYAALMREYDIRDADELHNMIRRLKEVYGLCSEVTRVCRMPYVVIGTVAEGEP